MFQKWWMKLVKEKMKGSGYEVTFIMSYNQAMMWNAVEAILYIYVGVTVLYIIHPVMGRMSATLALIPFLVIWSKMLRLMDYHRRNCWHTQPEPKKEPFQLFKDLDR